MSQKRSLDLEPSPGNRYLALIKAKTSISVLFSGNREWARTMSHWNVNCILQWPPFSPAYFSLSAESPRYILDISSALFFISLFFFFIRQHPLWCGCLFLFSPVRVCKYFNKSVKWLNIWWIWIPRSGWGFWGMMRHPWLEIFSKLKVFFCQYLRYILFVYIINKSLNNGNNRKDNCKGWNKIYLINDKFLSRI